MGSVWNGYPLRFDYAKKKLIDTAFRMLPVPPRSFADLGGVWGIDGAYSFYTLNTYPIDRAFLNDTDMMPTVREKQGAGKHLLLIEDDFGKRSTAERIGKVDAVYLFDVLLHQVNPDWNEILRLYAEQTSSCLIYNQQFIAGTNTVRLPDLGREESLEHVPMEPDSPGYKNLFERPYAMHPRYHKPYHDVHNVWQWRITDDDFVMVLEQLGFRPLYRKNHGRFNVFESFENHAFLFTRHMS